jgi:hypothetical protein
VSTELLSNRGRSAVTGVLLLASAMVGLGVGSLASGNALTDRAAEAAAAAGAVTAAVDAGAGAGTTEVVVLKYDGSSAL